VRRLERDPNAKNDTDEAPQTVDDTDHREMDQLSEAAARPAPRRSGSKSTDTPPRRRRRTLRSGAIHPEDRSDVAIQAHGAFRRESVPCLAIGSASVRQY
jgi:hypothetical protein